MVKNNTELIREMDSKIQVILSETTSMRDGLDNIAEGNKVSELTQDDWKGIANTVSKYAVLMDDDSYSLFVFRAYEKYIRGSVEQIRFNVSPETAALILGLADELHEKDTLFIDGQISEVTYIEDCLWISLEAMMKLIASTAALAHCEEFENLSQALAAYAFEYGRLMLYKREQEIITQYLEAQKMLDAELEAKYNSYLEDLQKQAEQFNELIANAYNPNFREAFLHSVILAQEMGVEENEILKTVEDVDDFLCDLSREKKMFKSIKTTTSRSFVDKNVKKGITYTYKVRSFMTIDGEKHLFHYSKTSSIKK